MISGAIPPVPQFHGNVQDWVRDITVYLESVLREHSEDIKTIYGEFDVNFLGKDTEQGVIIGPLIDAMDGKTVLTDTAGLTLSDITCSIFKGVNRTTVSLTSGNFVHIADGYWQLTLTAGNTDTSGYILITLRDDDVMLSYSERFVVK